jgi:hypothetical protein
MEQEFFPESTNTLYSSPLKTIVLHNVKATNDNVTFSSYLPLLVDMAEYGCSQVTPLPVLSADTHWHNKLEPVRRTILGQL